MHGPYKVTSGQAVAFRTALTGAHGSMGPEPNSIGAKFHLEAVLGESYDTTDFRSYLSAVVDALGPEPTPLKLLDEAHADIREAYTDIMGLRKDQASLIAALKGYTANHDAITFDRQCNCSRCVNARWVLSGIRARE